MKDLFPIIDTPQRTDAAELPMFRDIGWDFETDAPRFGPDGEPVMAEGLEALKSWALNAIRTERYRWELYEFNYGCEIRRLVGQQYSEDTKLAEAARYIQEALAVNPYIKSVQVTGATFEGSRLSMDVLLETIYGEATVHV